MNECRIDNEFVSRRHARLEYREGKFFLTDSSTNGIMVVSSTGRRLFVHRETVTLEGEGRMHVGRMDENTLAFVLETRSAEGASWLPVRNEEPEEEAAAAPAGNVLRQEGEYWTIAYAGSVVRMKDSRGLQFLAWLLRHPGEQIHVLDLMLAASDGAPPPSPAPVERTAEPQGLDGGSVGPLLDAKAKSAYKERLGSLKEELAEAERFGDIGRATRAREELDFLAHQLAGALGLGGRDREVGSSAERARVAVTMRIRDALKRIRLCHPKLATHLAASVKTGRFCSYGVEPARSEEWTG
jgi:non-specific serine/threonine protein kinase